MRTRTLLALGVGGAAGAAITHLFDPDQGPARRARLGDQARRQWREIQGRSPARAGVPQGHGAADNPSPDDATLADKVRSEVLGKAEFGTYPIDVDVARGTVHLRGEVPTDVAERVEEAVERVAGVTSVESFLHPAGTPAPNKASARSASRGGEP